MFRREPQTCAEEFEVTNLEIREKRQTELNVCNFLQWIVLQVFQEASGTETSNAVTFYLPKHSRGKIKMGSQHIILN